MNSLEELKEVLEKTETRLIDLESSNGVLEDKIKAYRTAVKSGMAAGFEPDAVKADQQFGTLLKGVVKKSYGNKLTDEEVDLLERSPRATKDEGEPTVKASAATDLTSDATTGSYNVPTEIWDEIQRSVEENSELIPMVRTVPMSSLTKTVAVEDTSIDFTYVATQGGDTTESAPVFAQETLKAYTYAAYVGVSEELMEDEVTGLGEFFRNVIGQAYARKFDAEFLTGSGAPTTGLMNDADVQAVSMPSGSPGFDDLELSDFLNMEEELSTRNGALVKAGWIMSPYTWNKIKRKVDATGRPLIMDVFNNAAQKSILGYPVHLSYQAPSSSDDSNSTPFIGLGNYKQMIYGARIPLEIKYFPNTSYMVTNCEAFWRFRWRGGFVISLPENFAVLSTSAS